TVVRPYTTPGTIGAVPTNATFDASYSISGVGGSLTNSKLTYIWYFVDGTFLKTNNPIVSHTFTIARDSTVNLTVRNQVGWLHNTSSRYRLLGTNADFYLCH